MKITTADTIKDTLATAAASPLREAVVAGETTPCMTPEVTVPHLLAPPSLRGTINAYIALTKPRIISLLLFTTLAAMYIANDAQHPVSFVLFWAVAIGGYMMAGAANAINMVIDRDIDGRMARTAKRPTVTQFISSRNALLFALTLSVLSFGMLWHFGCLQSALFAFAGLAFYVVVYTLILKRRTWQNIVWGGAAGSFPPLVGWTAVTHSMQPLAWTMFAIIFVWTPVHFWALAILLKEDYAKAGIPMLPSVRGERVTVVQISYYTALTIVVTLLPFVQHQASYIYLAGAGLLNVFLVSYTYKLFRKPERPQASHLFHYSMIYLAALFLVMAIDHNVLRPW